MAITVFASSSARTPSPYLSVAAELGQALALAGQLIINGAGADGCMGALNDAALAAGGQVKGVNLRKFVEQGFIHPGLSDVAIVDTMRERKSLLGQHARAFIVLPGGPGTWEEMWEVVVERQIETHHKPLVVINVNGFYDGFLQQLARAEQEGFLYGPAQELLKVVDDVAAALKVLDLATTDP